MLRAHKSREQLVAEILNLQVTTSILDNIIDVLWVKDLNGNYVMVSESFTVRHGKPSERVIGKTDFTIHPPYLAVQYAEHERMVLKHERKYVFLETELLPDGTEQNFEVCRSPVYDFSGQIVGTLGVSRDIADRQKMEQSLIYLSSHDTLTGLYNRRYFEKTPKVLLSQGICSIGLILCDIDGLKIINDTLGHQIGDRVLVDVAHVLKVHIGEYGTVARIGGDEFAAILPETTAAELELVCHGISQAVKHIESGLDGIPISISNGYSVADITVEPFEQLFRRVDDAMQKEKLLRNQSHRSALAITMKEMLKARDFLTEEHGGRLQKLVCRLAKRLGMPIKDINELKLFSQFHDLGKIGISDQILFKPGPLSLEEMAEMRRHSQIGFRIAQSIPELAVIADWILKHHEWYDGNGYPLGIRGEEIPLACRILAIVDAFDAMVSDRPYRKAMSQWEAREELIEYAGRQFDPRLVKLFLEMIDL